MTRPRQLSLVDVARRASTTPRPRASIEDCARGTCRACSDREGCSVARLIYGPPPLRVVEEER